MHSTNLSSSRQVAWKKDFDLGCVTISDLLHLAECCRFTVGGLPSDCVLGCKKGEQSSVSTHRNQPSVNAPCSCPYCYMPGKNEVNIEVFKTVSDFLSLFLLFFKGLTKRMRIR